jgi:hypothetical protein
MPSARKVRATWNWWHLKYQLVPMARRVRLRQERHEVNNRASYNPNLEGVCPLERPIDKEIRHARTGFLRTLFLKCNGMEDEIAQQVTKSLKL